VAAHAGVIGSLTRATVAKHWHADRDFGRRYRQLLDHARTARREPGFADANLTRGLTSVLATPPAPDRWF
jgi:hypothetical protein